MSAYSAHMRWFYNFCPLYSLEHLIPASVGVQTSWGSLGVGQGTVYFVCLQCLTQDAGTQWLHVPPGGHGFYPYILGIDTFSCVPEKSAQWYGHREV